MATITSATLPKHPEDTHLTDLVKEDFKVINATNPEATMSSWLCFELALPYYEDMALLRTVSQTKDVNDCR